jgi:hypothetical protein
LEIELIANKLDELHLPCKFDVKDIMSIKNNSLREHIERVGIVIFSRESENK